MKIKKERNSIILCLCSIIVLIASVFAFMPINNESNTVYADSVISSYTFSGSNISSKTTFTNGEFSYNLFPLSIISGTTFIDYELPNPIEAGTYTFSTIVESTDIDSTLSLISFYNDGQWLYEKLITRGSYVSFTFTITSSCTNIFFYANSGYSTSLGDTFSYNDIQITKGSNVLPYQPYQDSTYLNYEFDLFSSYLSSNGQSYIQVTADIDGSSYAYVWPNDDIIHSTDKSLYNVFGNSAPNPNSNVHYINSFRFLKYDSTNDVLDSNYEFYLYTSFDYLSDPTGNYFESNISYVVLGSYLDYQSYFNYTYENEVYTGFNINTHKYNFISYVDFNNRNFNIFIPLDSTNDYDYWDFRTYYLSSLNDSTSEKVYNSGYNTGYNTGYREGEITGQQNGFKNGYNTGKNDGYNLGYNTALENDDSYSFTNLIASVIDVPVKAFTSLFNFEILGVNLSGFFLGLLTCCIVIGVIRLIL